MLHMSETLSQPNRMRLLNFPNFSMLERQMYLPRFVFWVFFITISSAKAFVNVPFDVDIRSRIGDFLTSESLKANFFSILLEHSVNQDRLINALSNLTKNTPAGFSGPYTPDKTIKGNVFLFVLRYFSSNLVRFDENCFRSNFPFFLRY